MVKQTLTWVSDVGTEPDQYGNLYVNVAFADESVAYIAGKQPKIAEHHAALTALLNTEAEFNLEDKGKSKKGKPKFKINGYPGWERTTQDGGGKSSWYNSEEGVRFTQDQTNRRTALMSAREMGGILPPDVLQAADLFYAWLSTSEPHPSLSVGVSEDGAGTAGREAGTPLGEGSSSPAPQCLHPKANADLNKPEDQGGGPYRAGYARCGLCDRVMPTNEMT